MILGPSTKRELSALHADWGIFLNPFFSFSARKKRTVSIFQEKKESRAKPELQTVPPSRQKKPAAFRFRRGGESSISAGSFFLSKL